VICGAGPEGSFSSDLIKINRTITANSVIQPQKCVFAGSLEHSNKEIKITFSSLKGGIEEQNGLTGKVV